MIRQEADFHRNGEYDVSSAGLELSNESVCSPEPTRVDIMDDIEEIIGRIKQKSP